MCAIANPYVERFVRSIKSEYLAQIIRLRERHLREAVKQYTERYHIERGLADADAGRLIPQDEVEKRFGVTR